MKKIIRHLKNTILIYPRLYFPLASLNKNSKTMVSKSTNIVIDGFPRSGNSYIEAAFRLSQDPNLNISHHTHAAANVIQAVRFKKPCYVLIRRPEDAVVSLIQHEPSLYTISTALARYRIFYKALSKVSADIFFVKFDDATKNFNETIKQFNKFYDLNLKPLPDDIDKHSIMYLVDQLAKERKTITGITEPYSVFASDEIKNVRARQKSELYQRLMKKKYEKSLNECRQVYAHTLVQQDLNETL